MRKSTVIVAVLAALFVPSMAQAAKPKDPAAAPAAAPAAPASPKAVKTYPLTGVVAAVNQSTLTIKGGAGKPDRVFAITPQTVIVNGGKPATVADIKVGQKVGGSVEESSNGDKKALKINLGVKQAAAPKPPKTPKAG